MAQWIMLGEPVNEFERQVCEYLRDNLPAEDYIFTNFSISRSRDKNCEIDCFLLSARKGLYVIEIKPGDKPLTGRWDGFTGNPIDQADSASKIIRGKLQTWNDALEGISVKFLVGLTGEKNPSLNQLSEDNDRKKHVVWYRNLPDYLNRRQDQGITPPLFDMIRQAVESNFSRQHEWIGEYQILGEAWKSSLYTACYAKGAAYPHKYLLKIYDMPQHENRDIHREFIADLNRELDAVNRIAESGDQQSGGSQNVIIGKAAFAAKRETQYVVVMQWVSGRPLAELIGPQSPLTLEQKCRIAAQVCRGMAFAHSAGKGVIHRNLHPGNIIIDRSGNAKITNFDFARFLDSSVHPKSLVGDTRLLAAWQQELTQRRQYAAPEILKGGNGAPVGESPRYTRATPETDIYSIGVILWELFSSQAMSESIDQGRMAKALEEGGISAPVSRTISEMCADEPSARPRDLIMLAKGFEIMAAGRKPSGSSLPEYKAGDNFKEYPIIKLLASTDMSLTYIAQDKLSDGKVTIKFLKTKDPQAAREETRRVRNLSQKVQLTGRCAAWLDGGFVGEDSTRVYYQVMDYIEGESLKDVIWKYGVPEASRAVQLGLEIIRCVKVIHEAGWTHRDIKPANFILTPNGEVKIIDFGLSRRIEETSHIQAATLGYTPPEVLSKDAEGNEIGEWTQSSDVYSIACLIVALLCGEKMDILNGPDYDEKTVDEKAPAWKDLLISDRGPDPSKRNSSAVEMLSRYEKAMEDVLTNASQSDMDENPNVIKEKNGVMEPVSDQQTTQTPDIANSNSTAESEINLLKLRLDERIDMSKLKGAIDDAELREGHGKLPDILVTLMKEARKFYDAKRIQDDQLTTNARSNEVYKTWLAVEMLSKEASDKIYDSVSGAYNSTATLLSEAKANLKDLSKNAVQVMKTYFEDNKNRPDLVAVYLEKNELVRDLAPEYATREYIEFLHLGVKKEWELLKKQINVENKKYGNALEERDRGDSEVDPVIKYEHYQHAQTFFPALPGIEEKIALALTPARAAVDQFVENNIIKASKQKSQISEDRENFNSARSSLIEAREKLEKWQKTSREGISSQKEKIDRENNSITKIEENYLKIESKVAEIEASLKPVHVDLKVIEAKEKDLDKLKKEIIKEEALKNYFHAILEDLEGKIASKKGVESAKDLAKKAVGKRIWVTAIAALEVYVSVDAEAKSIYEQAEQELCIDNIIASVKEENIRKASELLITLPEEIQGDRLRTESQLISSAQKKDEVFLRYFEQAEQLKSRPQVREQCKAYAIYARLGNKDIPEEVLPAGISDYALSSYTFDARKTYDELGKILMGILSPLVVQFDSRNQNELYPSAALSAEWAIQARSLRGVGLISDSQRPAACWVEAGFAKDSGAEVEAWKELAAAYAGFEEVTYGLRKSRARQIVVSAKEITDAELRVTFIQEQQGENLDLVGDVDILICLAKAYEQKHDFAGALQRVHVSLVSGTEEEKALLQTEYEQLTKEQTIHKTLADIKILDQRAIERQGHEAQRLWREALEELNKSSGKLGNPDRRLTERADRIFEEASKLLDPSVYLNLATPSGYLEGILALIDFVLLCESGDKIVSALPQQPNRDKAGSESQIKTLMGNPLIVGQVVLALEGLVNSVDPRDRSFQWADAPVDEVKKVVQDVMKKIDLVKKYSPQPALQNLVASLSQVTSELDQLVLKPNSYLYQHPWQDAVMNPLDGKSWDWKNAVQINSFTRLDNIKINILQNNGSVLAKILEGRNFIDKLNATQKTTTCLLDIIGAIRFLHSGEQFEGVVTIIDWTKIPLPWQQPIQIPIREGFARIDWTVILPIRMGGILGWMKGIGENPTFPLPEDLRTVKLSNVEYGQIRSWLDVFPIYYMLKDEEFQIIGWDGTRNDAGMRGKNLKLWNDLLVKVAKDGKRAWQSYQLAEIWADEKIPWVVTTYGNEQEEHIWEKEYMQAQGDDALFPNANRWLNKAVTSAREDKLINVVNGRDTGLERFNAEKSIDGKLPQSYQGWFWEHANTRLLALLLIILRGPIEIIDNPVTLNVSFREDGEVVITISSLLDKSEREYNFLSRDDITAVVMLSPLQKCPVLSNTANPTQGTLFQLFWKTYDAASSSLNKFENVKQSGDFPSEGELSRNRSQNSMAFQQLMETAREIGPKNLEEAKRYWIYKKFITSVKKNFWEKLAERLGL